MSRTGVVLCFRSVNVFRGVLYNSRSVVLAFVKLADSANWELVYSQQTKVRPTKRGIYIMLGLFFAYYTHRTDSSH